MSKCGPLGCTPTRAGPSAPVRPRVPTSATCCSRLDLYLDWQAGWHPAFDSGDERHFVKRVHAEVNRHSCDGELTGYDIGCGEVRARIYNKSVQVQKEHIDWYPELVRARNGLAYDDVLAIWQVEFQLRREGVKGF